MLQKRNIFFAIQFFSCKFAIMLKPELLDKEFKARQLTTVKEYAKFRGITPFGVYSAIRNNWKMEGVEAVLNIHGTNIIVMEEKPNDSAS
jgi:hypothetical protein